MTTIITGGWCATCGAYVRIDRDDAIEDYLDRQGALSCWRHRSGAELPPITLSWEDA